MQNPQGFFATSLTSGILNLMLHEKYWGKGEFVGQTEMQRRLIQQFRHPKVFNPDLIGLTTKPHGEHCMIADGADPDGALQIHALLAKGLAGFEEGRQYATENAQFPEAIIQNLPPSAQDACYTFTVTQLKQMFNIPSTETEYTTSSGHVVSNAGYNSSVSKFIFTEANLPFYVLATAVGDVLIIPVEKIETVEQFNQTVLSILDSNFERLVQGKGSLCYPIIGKTKLPINIDGLGHAQIPGTNLEIFEAKGVMEFELSLTGYESRTEATMLSGAKGMMALPAFQEQIETDFIILNLLDLPEGGNGFVEAVYVPFDELLNA